MGCSHILSLSSNYSTAYLQSESEAHALMSFIRLTSSSRLCVIYLNHFLSASVLNKQTIKYWLSSKVGISQIITWAVHLELSQQDVYQKFQVIWVEVLVVILVKDCNKPDIVVQLLFLYLLVQDLQIGIRERELDFLASCETHHQLRVLLHLWKCQKHNEFYQRFWVLNYKINYLAFQIHDLLKESEQGWSRPRAHNARRYSLFIIFVDCFDDLFYFCDVNYLLFDFWDIHYLLHFLLYLFLYHFLHDFLLWLWNLWLLLYVFQSLHQ